MRQIRFAAMLAASMLVICGLARGQAVDGTLVGTVSDSSGAVVAGAQITAVEENTQISRTSLTNDSGNFTFANVPPGTYRVTAEQAGFKREARAGVTLDINTTIRVDLQLSPGEVSETVEVAATAATLQTDRADTGRQIETKLVADLPLTQGRNFQNLLNLVPGTTRAFRPHSEFFNPQNALSTQVNGQSRLGNNLQLEGIDNNERTGLLQVLIPPIEAIQTVDVTTSNYEAELGRATGAVTNVFLKSGTNAIHGGVYEFNRVSALAARNYFDKSRGNFTYNYVGGNVGGPIIKNRTFIFGDYLRVMDHRANTNTFSIPSAKERNGDLSEWSSVIYDPATGNPDGTGRTPFPNNQIPANRIDPITSKILALVPQPTGPGLTSNLFLLTPFSRDTDSYDVKVDHNQTLNDRISVRYSYSRPVTFDGSAFGDAGGPRGGGFQATGVQGTHNGAINYTHIFSPTFITEARAGLSRYRNDAQQIDYGKNDSDALGVPGVNLNDFTSGYVGVDVGGLSSPLIGYSASLPWIRAETNIDFVNSWTKTLGNHTVKWGGDLRRVRDDLLQTQTFSPRGLFQFRQSQTSIPGATATDGNSFASFLLDVPSQVGRDLPIIFPAYRAWQFFAFLQDKWVVTPKLTVDLGVRWEFYPPAKPAHDGGFSQYDPSTNSLLIAGLGDVPSDLGIRTNYKDFAPRIGIAYRFNDKTVFRGGFGLSYAPFPDNTYAFNFPVKQNNAFLPNESFGPAVLPNGSPATFAAGFPAPTPATIPDNGIIPANTPLLLNQNYDVINPRFREPYVMSWNVAAQRSLPWNFVLEAAYVANKGVAQPAVYNLNASQTIGADNAGRPLFGSFGRKADTNLRFVGYSSSYNSLQVKVDRRFSSAGLALTTAYTWSKSLGFQSEDAGLTFYINPQRNWQELNFSRRHNFVQSYVYELPFGHGKRWLTAGAGAWVLGGWQVNGILSLSSGTPLTFSYSGDDLKAPGNGNTVDFIGDGIDTPKGIDKGNQWFNNAKCGGSVTTNCFSRPAPLTFGNLGLGVLAGPGFFNLDASLFRKFAVTERVNIELRGEAFGLTNTPQFNNPETSITSANFGYITTAAGGGRQVQLGVRIQF